ncbi:beta-ketoacyl-[acyl-carrier-protein] synthase family protein [Methylacidimicrobium sp. B4]|uniref:beta-ketoacyl-[acyl-carrier-protein] synthase family protein n=1 Tax=Methylacidimicrobium sp. B4 TaxID=2796139 RepID=UPI001A8CC157|nr:beta-ketoacyl-[acyl-carrier-protein] synthase family protein [Methylacidimicrobium sp. B4]QSR85106.1 beta-ketoacyl-[acyl-carrier-protein] synthase family protein [Methylacidimicrobium sp. B4]
MVTVTGIGMVTALGGDVVSSWAQMLEGKDGARPVDLFSTEGCRCRSAAQAALPPLPLLSPGELRRLPRASRLAIPAAREALAQAGLLAAGGQARLPQIPLCLATTEGGMELGERFLEELLAGRKGHLQWVGRYQPQQQAIDLQRAFGLRGRVLVIANSCSSGADAIGSAAQMIWSGEADCVLTGGFEALAETVFVGFDSLRILTTDRCAPFDQGRTGLLLGEGAAFLVLESLEHASGRQARPLCQITGYGQATDRHHLTQPAPDGSALCRAIESALAQAEVAPEAIGYLNAHGTGTSLNDESEANAYSRFFGIGWRTPRMSSVKAMIGHTLGAAGAIEAVFSILALQTGRLPPQWNSVAPLPEVEEALVRPGEPLQTLNHVMSANVGFGGSNAALVFSRHD